MLDNKSLSAKEREYVLKVVSEGSFLDGVFHVERFNRGCGLAHASAELPLAEIYPAKTQEELRIAAAQVRQLEESALAYVCAVIDQRPEREALRAKVFENNLGFSKQTYDIAFNDAFFAMR
ncbi:hypothetical protein [Ralstonia sp. ASV6]|uniref:hypothetical protein n=1 Tax=Ralstonia sp. ASV6 TaxID=2795124 RepID=UPI0018EC57FF|nr:hypothetical protein [Ralstonia sp. ASV6]